MWSPYPVLSLLLLCSCCWAESDPIVQTKYGKVSSYLIKSVCQLQTGSLGYSCSAAAKACM